MATDRINFTKAAIQALPVPEPGKRAYHYDSKTRGLVVSVTETGAKTFQVYRKVKGKPERITLGRFPDLTVEQARKKAAVVNGAVAKGENPNDARRAERGEMTLDDLFREYRERTAEFNKRSDKAQDTYDLYLAHWGKRKLSSVTHSDVSKWHRALPEEIKKRRERQNAERVEKAGRGKKRVKVARVVKGHVSANIALKLLHVMFNKAINEWRIWKGENPAHGIPKFRESSRERFIRSDEMPRFFKALAEEENATIQDYIFVSLLTGARRSNVLAMRWEDISFERAEWRIPETKNGTPQTIPLVSEVVTILQRRKPTEAKGFVFPGSGKSGHLVEPKKGWQRILGRAGLADLRLHDLRRTLGSWQASTGANLSVISKTLHHSNIDTTMIYARLSQEPVREAMQKAGAAMLSAGGVHPSAEVVSVERQKATKG
jgi:integrase